MCVIFHKPANVKVSEQDIRNAHRINDDGFGYMYFDKEKQRIVAEKFVTNDVNKILEIVNRLQDKEVCYHFRIKTHGIIADSSSHPFRITSKKKHGLDLYFMHNGMINGMEAQKDESDTQAFNRTWLIPILKRDPGLIKVEAFRKLVEEKIGRGNKLCFMLGDGSVFKCNEKSGDTHAGMWVSNTNFVTRTITNIGPTKWDREKQQWVPLDDTKSEDCQNYYNTLSNRSRFMSDVGKRNGEVYHKLIDDFVKPGDKVCIWNRNENSFYTEGTIVSFTNFAAYIQFKDAQGVENSVGFSLATGEGHGMYSSYECIAMNTSKFDGSKTVEQVEKQDSLADLGAEVIQLEDKTEKKVDTDPIAKTPDQDLVTYKGVQIDTGNRYGGAWLEDSLSMYTGTSILDFYNMDKEARVKFFLDNQEVAFNMLQDLTEKQVLEDVDNDIVDMDGNDTDDVDPTEDTVSEEEQRMIEQAKLAGICR